MAEQEVLISLENLQKYHQGLIDSLPGEVWIGTGDPNEYDTEDSQIFGVDTTTGNLYYRYGKFWTLIEESGESIETEVKLQFKDPNNPDNTDYQIPKEFLLSGDDTEFKLKFAWQCLTPGEDNNFTVPVRTKGTIEIHVNGGLKESFTEYSSTDKREVIIQRDLINHLTVGKNTVKIVALNPFGESASYDFTVYIIALSLTGTTFQQNSICYQKNLVENDATAVSIDVYLEGPGEKTGHVYINGKLSQTTDTIPESDGFFSIDIPNSEIKDGIETLCHGAYFVEVFITSNMKDDIRSNSICFDFIYVDDYTTDRANTAIIASTFNQKQALQYEKMIIPFFVYKAGVSNIATKFSIVQKEYDEENNLIYKKEISSSEPYFYKTETPLEWEVSYNEDMIKGSNHNIYFKIEVGSSETDAQGKITSMTVEDEKEYHINISQRDIPDATPITTSLGLSFIAEKTAIDNGNNDKNVWISTGLIKQNNAPIRAIFSDFDWTNGGWTTAEGRSALHLTNKSKLEIPYPIFEQKDITINQSQVSTKIIKKGLTVEVDVNFSNVIDSEAPFFTCFGNNIGITISPSQATLSNGVNTVITRYENPKSKRYQNSMHFTFVISKENKKTVQDKDGKEVTTYLGGMYIYINGIGAAAQEYSRAAEDNSDKFVHTENVYFNSNGCDIDLFGFRMYYADLNTFQILNNWIADMDINNRIDAYINNYLFDKEAIIKSVLLDEASKHIPCMIITGERPQFKGDKKKKTHFKFIGTENERFDFDLYDAQWDVQGTSSQYYPVKNWKFKRLENNFRYPLKTGKKASKTYAFADNQIPSSVFCLKADYMETSSTHNTVTANIAHSIYDKEDYGKTPPQRKDETGRVRTTIYGIPILVFYKETEESTPVFGGKYNFNYDKDSEEVFGFVPPEEGEDGYSDFELIECVEFKENRDEIGLFTTKFYDGNRGESDGYGNNDLIEISEADVDSYDKREIVRSDGKVYVPKWAKAFEFRAYYRKEDDGTPETRRAYIQAVADWIYELDANTASNKQLSAEKQVDFTKGSASYEYDLDMNKVTFKYAPDNIPKERAATRTSLDLGSKVPEELDYEIETFYEVRHIIQETNNKGEKEEKNVINPKIFSKEKWERKILSRKFADFYDNTEYNIELQYKIKHIKEKNEEEQNDKLIYEINCSRKDWEETIFEAPEDLEYSIGAYIEVKFLTEGVTEPISVVSYEKELYDESKLKLPEGATHYTTQKYFQVKYINKNSNKTQKTIRYSLDEWKDFDFDMESTKNIFTTYEKYYILYYNNKQIVLTQDEWGNEVINLNSINLELSEEENQLIQEAINNSLVENSNKTFLKRARIYYSLVWSQNEPDNPDSYNKGKEVYRFNKDTRNYRLSRFKTEFSEHFNEHFCVMYFILMEMLGMIDSSTKNMFWATWGERHENHQQKTEDGKYKDKSVIWYPIFYDMDSILGIDNVGKMEIPYNVEYDTILSNGEHAYNGYGNVFWENFRASYVAEIGEKLREKINNGTLSLERLLKAYEDHSNKFCEFIYNEDGDLKILDVYFTGYDVVTGYTEGDDGKLIPVKRTDYANWMHVYQGDRYYYRNFWLPNRFNYICSKNRAGNYVNDYISMRLNDPRLTSAENTDVNYDFEIETWKDQYVRIKYGGFSIAKIFSANQKDWIISPQKSYNDTETAIYGASNIKSIGNISNKYANSIKLEQATRLLYFDAGSDDDNYSNNSLQDISFGSNTMLQRVNLSNCRALKKAINLSSCPSIKEIILKNTLVEEVMLPSKGKIETLILPKTINKLIITDQPNIKIFELPVDEQQEQEKYNLNTLKIFNTPNINTQDLVEKSIDTLTSLNLNNIDWESTDGTLLTKIIERIDSTGPNALKGEGKNKRPILKGIYRIPELPSPIQDKADLYFNEVDKKEQLPKFEERQFKLYVTKPLTAFAITFKNYDGTLLDSGIPGGYVTADQDIIYRGPLPTRLPSWDRKYNFVGWTVVYEDNSPNSYIDDPNVTEKNFGKTNQGLTFIARYEEEFKEFNFIFQDNLLGTEDKNTLYTNYEDKSIEVKKLNNYTTKVSGENEQAHWRGRYFLYWRDENGKAIYGGTTLTIPDLSNSPPEEWKEVYDFYYTANYGEEERLYVVSFQDKDGNYLKLKNGEEEIPYKELPFFKSMSDRESFIPIVIPEGEDKFYATETHTYKFIGWKDSDIYNEYEEKAGSIAAIYDDNNNITFNEVRVDQNIFGSGGVNGRINYNLTFKPDYYQQTRVSIEFYDYNDNKIEDDNIYDLDSIITLPNNFVLSKEADKKYSYNFMGWIFYDEANDIITRNNKGDKIIFLGEEVKIKVKDYENLFKNKNYSLQVKPGYKYNWIEYRITFHGINGGTGDRAEERDQSITLRGERINPYTEEKEQDQLLTYEASIIKPGVNDFPTKIVGYNITGWTTDLATGKAEDVDLKVIGNRDYYMLFKKQTFEVSFNYKKGETTDKGEATNTSHKISVDYNTGFSVPTDNAIYNVETYLKQYKATAANWYDENNQPVTDFNQIKVTKDLKYTLKYQETDVFHMILYKNDATSIITSKRFYIEKDENDKYIYKSQQINIPTSGIVKGANETYEYKFLGWILKSKNEKVQEDSKLVTDPATVYFAYNNASIPDNISVDLKFNDELIELCSKYHELELKPGYDYVHILYPVIFWGINGGNPGQTIGTQYGRSMTINYYYDEPLSKRVPSVNTDNNDDCFKQPIGFTYQSGYWKTKAHTEGQSYETNKVDLSTHVKSNGINIYAVWERNTCTVQFRYMKDASGTSTNGNTMYDNLSSKISGKYGTYINVNTDFQKKVYSANQEFTFQSWHYGDDTSGSRADNGNNQVLVATDGNEILRAKYSYKTRQFSVIWKAGDRETSPKYYEYGTGAATINNDMPDFFKVRQKVTYNGENYSINEIDQMTALTTIKEDMIIKAKIGKIQTGDFNWSIGSKTYNSGKASGNTGATLSIGGWQNFSLVGLPFSKIIWSVTATCTGKAEKNVKAMLTYLSGSLAQKNGISQDIGTTDTSITLSANYDNGGSQRSICESDVIYLGIYTSDAPSLGDSISGTFSGINFNITYTGDSISY